MTQFVDILGYERIAAHASALPFAPKRERFIFVRHGETEGNRNHVYQFPHTPLNETGEGQARARRQGAGDNPHRQARRKPDGPRLAHREPDRA